MFGQDELRGSYRKWNFEKELEIHNIRDLKKGYGYENIP